MQVGEQIPEPCRILCQEHDLDAPEHLVRVGRKRDRLSSSQTMAHFSVAVE